MLAQFLVGTNAPPFLTTIAAAGNSFDLNGDPDTGVHQQCTRNMNTGITSRASLATTASNAVTNNTDSSHQSQASAVTISGPGPIILTANGA